jgi:hypothetical protein
MRTGWWLALGLALLSNAALAQRIDFGPFPPSIPANIVSGTGTINNVASWTGTNTLGSAPAAAVSAAGLNLGAGGVASGQSLYSLYILKPAGTQAYLGSTGANSSILHIDTQQAGQQSDIFLDDAGTNKWQIGKDTSSNFFLFNVATGHAVMQIATANDQLFFPVLPTVGGSGGLFMCVDAGGGVYKKATCP